ncbi:MAG: dihydrofolate reductase [Bacilli bacterium]|nr:dihydrofolate reductase [Bacilli bacterium]
MISLIAAVGKNNELGKNNDLIWRLPNDLKFFKSVTNGKVVVMGRNTFWSLPGVLPNRTNVVISDVLEDYPDGVVVYGSIDDVLNNFDDFFVIGGAYVYKQFIDMADNLYLTEVDSECLDASVYFPSFDRSLFDKEIIGSNCDNGISYKHVLYKRR